MAFCVLFLCCLLLHDMHSFSPFALGCGFFRSGSSLFDPSERREGGGALVAPIGGPSCLIK